MNGFVSTLLAADGVAGQYAMAHGNTHTMT
jgi:hypothetical protein